MIGSGNGLLSDVTKPLAESMLSYHQKGPVTFIRRQFHQIPQLQITRINLKITYKISFKLGANELMAWHLLGDKLSSEPMTSHNYDL